jgi:hypothetical protein
MVAVKFDQERKFASIPVGRFQAEPERFVGVGNAFHAKFMPCLLNNARCENLIPAIIEWSLRARRMVEWIMSRKDPATFTQELATFVQKCNGCEICATGESGARQTDEHPHTTASLRPPNNTWRRIC